MNVIPLIVLFLLLLLVTGAAGYLLYRQRQTILDIRNSRDEIEGKERLAFDFLHGLGAELQKDYSAANMHRYIVEGIVHVLDGHGAALYLLDQSRERLAPAYISGGCPPLIALPDSVIAATDDRPSALTSYLRLQSISANHPVYSLPLKSHHSLRIDNLAEYPAFKDSTTELHEDVALIIGPLIYAEKPLGLIMVARQLPKPSFTDNEVDVFDSMADQSSFALGSAMVHKDAHDKRLLDSELRTASEFQRILLPACAPKLASFEIAASNSPAKVVSGDYFDYVEVDEEHLGVAIADVSGKGVPASLIMATCRSVLRAKAVRNTSPSEVLRVVNRQIFPDIREDMFITMAYLILNGASDQVTMARAGHNPPFVYRQATGEVEDVGGVGMAVGIDSGGVFDRILKDQEFSFYHGDVILLYTDGVTEALNEKGEEYGEDRMRDALKRYAGKSAQELIDKIAEEVDEFAGGKEQSDDITLIAIKKG